MGCKKQGENKYVLAGIIAWGIGCGNGIPGVYASVKDALCFIDWDTRCKHGIAMTGHYDYRKECSGWMEEVKSTLEEYGSIFNSQLRKLKKLKDSCQNFDKINEDENLFNEDGFKIGDRTES